MKDYTYLSVIVVFLAIVLLLRTNKKPWSELTAKEKRNKIISIVGFAILLIAGVALYFIK